jgi:hypothetical protein
VDCNVLACHTAALADAPQIESAKQCHPFRRDAAARGSGHVRGGKWLYEPSLSGGLHPGSDQRYELTDEEQSEITMLQGGKGITL